MRLRQIALVAEDRDTVVDDLCAVLDVEVCFHDPGVAYFGLHNALMPLGDTFLEVVSPTAANTAAGRYRDRLGGDAGYMLMLQTADFERDRRRMDDLGVRVVWYADLDDIRSMHLHPKDTGGTLLSLDQPTPPEAWRWGGPDVDAHRRHARVGDITGAEVQCAEPAAMAKRWSELLALPVEEDDDGALSLPLDGAHLRFTRADERGERLAAFDVTCRDPETAVKVAQGRQLPVRSRAVRIAGTWIHLIG